MCYKGKEKLLSEIVRELKVDAVVESSVLHVADQVRITAQLVLVSPEEYLWAENFNDRIENILSLQNDVAVAITNAVTQKITEGSTRKKYSVKAINAEVYYAYLKGGFFWNKRTAEGYQKTIHYVNQAIKLDPACALAYAGLADCYNLVVILALCAEAYALAGDAIRAQEILHQLRQLTQQRYLSPYWEALVHLALGDRETAFKSLALAVQYHSVTLVWLNVDPKFNAIRLNLDFRSCCTRWDGKALRIILIQ
ncbi:hypothetical protein JXJ21_03510 [candidate division KSB1 bacterium]|nr:hypothetical protein [candidate division KSB1 bacterium]